MPPNACLNDETFSVQQAIAMRQQEAAEKLTKYGLQPQSYQDLVG